MLHWLVSTSIRLRVVLLAACVVLLVVGFRSLQQAPLDVFPEFAPPIVEIQTEAHNTSGLAIGGGYMWINSNGGVSGRRPPRPTDRPFGEIIQADMKTGKTIRAYRPPEPYKGKGVRYFDERVKIKETKKK